MIHDSAVCLLEKMVQGTQANQALIPFSKLWWDESLRCSVSYISIGGFTGLPKALHPLLNGIQVILHHWAHQLIQFHHCSLQILAQLLGFHKSWLCVLMHAANLSHQSWQVGLAILDELSWDIWKNLALTNFVLQGKSEEQVRGRTVLLMFDDYFKTSEEAGNLYSLEDLLKVQKTGAVQDLRRFINR